MSFFTQIILYWAAQEGASSYRNRNSYSLVTIWYTSAFYINKTKIKFHILHEFNTVVHSAYIFTRLCWASPSIEHTQFFVLRPFQNAETWRRMIFKYFFFDRDLVYDKRKSYTVFISRNESIPGFLASKLSKIRRKKNVFNKYRKFVTVDLKFGTHVWINILYLFIC